MITRESLEDKEIRELAPFACFSKNINRHMVEKHAYRTEFQRDRDRIIHSKAFRRLECKTQVFLTNKADHLRTRLTHTLEVSQMSRTLATQLNVNVDLTEAIALGHDVGHTPFGHIGERTLNNLLEQEGKYGFKHNVQSIRILELLENKYSYKGIRLTIPVKEGIIKHTKLPKEELPEYCQDLYINKPFSVTIEGQIVAIIDELAQITHDLDDYLRFGIINIEKVKEHSIFNDIRNFYSKEYKIDDIDAYINKNVEEDIKKDTLIRCLVDFLVTKLIESSNEKLKLIGNKKAFELDEVYIDFDNELKEKVVDFHKFLYEFLSSNSKIIEMDEKGEFIIQGLFTYYKSVPKRMPVETYKKYQECDGDKIRVIADYISGMTDRYALEQYQSIIDFIKK